MAQITAAQVKELRERTGSGMMECKRALEKTGGDIEAAVEEMRKAGLAKADNRADRTAAEGLIVIRPAADHKAFAMAEINCETDFVAKGEAFQQFAGAVADVALAARPADLEELLATPLAGEQSVEQVRRELVARIGENITVRRFVRVSTETGVLNAYRHGSRIGVLVELQGGDEALAKDIAMHVAASRPLCVSADQVPAELLAKEREIYTAQAQSSGKPPNIVAKMVEGRLGKYVTEVTLLGQPFVKDPEQTVAALLKSADARVVAFYRFELGEGIERKTVDFVQEVMTQAKGD